MENDRQALIHSKNATHSLSWTIGGLASPGPLRERQGKDPTRRSRPRVSTGYREYIVAVLKPGCTSV